MAKKRKRKRKSKAGNSSLSKVLVIAITLIGGFYLSMIDSSLASPDSSLDNDNETEPEVVEKVVKEVSSDLRVSFLDVGQADAILISNNGEEMLIDAGNNEDGKLLVKYFQDMGIEEFKYVVGTHPHEDHIGGMDDIIENFQIGKVYLPDAITTTKTFMDVLDAIEAKEMTFTVPEIGETFELGDAVLQVLYTGTDLKDLNNTSIVLRLDFGETSFLFTGDATEKTEEIILKNKLEVKADVLKVGHHGSKYSSTNAFLDKVKPTWAVISVGSGNSYKHPHSKTLKKLEKRNIEVHRTDLEGTIVVTSNGNDIMFSNVETDLNGG